MKVLQPMIWGLVLAAMLTAASSLSLFMVVSESQAASMVDSHAGHAGHGAEPQSQAAAKGPWLADAPLVAGMQRIQAAIAQASAGGDAFDSAALSHLLQLEVLSLIENCQLEPEADAALHALLVPLLENAARLHEEGDKQLVVAALQDTMREYQRSFVAPVERSHAH